MTHEQLWAALAFLLLCGWAATLILLSRSLLPMANALGVMHKIDDLFDKRINAVLDRYREQKKKDRVHIPDGKPQANPGDFTLTTPLIHAGMSTMEDQPDMDSADA